LITLSAHARIEIALVSVLLLSSCGQNAYHRFTEGDYDRLRVAYINAQNAIAKVDDLESRVDELEARLGD